MPCYSGLIVGVRFWNLRTGDEVRVLVGHDNWVNAVSFSPDGSRICRGAAAHRGGWAITAGVDGTVRLWDFSTAQPIRALQGHTEWVWAAVFSP